MCNLLWRLLIDQYFATNMWNTFVYQPWRYCSGNRNPCTWWCLCCNRWLCWFALIAVAILVIHFIVAFEIMFFVALTLCETFCVIGAILGLNPRCFAYAAPPPPASPNQPPLALTDGPYQGRVGQAIAMSAAASSDPEGAMLTATWTLGDGTTLTGMTISHAYANVGLFTVSVAVSDGTAAASSSTTANILFFGSEPPPPPIE